MGIYTRRGPCLPSRQSLSQCANMATQIPVDPTLVSANTLKLENTHNRDVLIAIEKKYQQEWQKNKVFESDAPSTSEIPFSSVPAAEIREKHPKYFGTFA